MSTRKTFLIRIFDGSDALSSFQYKAFERACAHFRWFREYEVNGIDVKIERWTNLIVKDEQKDVTTFAQIFDWLVEDSEEVHVDAYFVFCHMHQGFESWKASMPDLKEEFKRLAEHGNGYPDKHQIYCPVFLQDKFEYLKLIPKFVNPTLKIDVKESYSNRESSQIGAFWDLLCSTPSGGVIKAPFTTNRHWLKYPKQFQKDGSSKSSVEGCLNIAYTELFGSIPYVMMQPCIDIMLKSEVKVVFLGGKASHITTGFSVKKSSFPQTESQVIEFAQKAYDALREQLGPHHWLDQLARVDIMYNEFEQRMVINEVESLQACYEMKSECGREFDIRVEEFLEGSHVEMLETCVISKLNEMLLVLYLTMVVIKKLPAASHVHTISFSNSTIILVVS
jgi:hypothetical protein